MRIVLAFLGEKWEDAVLERVVGEPEVEIADESAIVAAIENTPRCQPVEGPIDEQVSHAK